MKIINNQQTFVLISMETLPQEGAVKLELNGSPYLSTVFRLEEYYNYQLLLYGLKDKEAFVRQLHGLVGEEIYIEQTKAQEIEVWSDAALLGKFELEHYQELVTAYEKEDWIVSYKGLLEYHFRQQESQTKRNIEQNRLMEQLAAFLEKEIKNFHLKNKFLKDKTATIKANEKALDLAYKIQQLIKGNKK